MIINNNFPELENIITTCTTSLSILKNIVKKIEENSNLLYQESKLVDNKTNLEQVKEKNNILQKYLKQIISNFNITHTEILNQLNKTKSIQIKMSILDDELNLMVNHLK